ncbi:Phthalyl amidase [Actinobacteria bacterium OK074]|nr:Phthalyl amidase [Actinobacteria bacterium OK074]
MRTRTRTGTPARRTAARVPVARVLAALATAVALSVTAPAAHAADTAASTQLTGALDDGGSWVADVPAAWNGTLLLFSHGFGITTAQDAPSDAVRTELLAEGYALAGSSYDPAYAWGLTSAERDQFATLDAVSAQIGKPTRTIAVGQSMGGLVNAQLARDADGRIDGALGLCGLVAGATDLDNYQLDAEYTIARLLLPDATVKLTGFASQTDALATGTTLTNAVDAAQLTAEGRARVALASAFLNLPTWAPNQDPPAADDWAGQEQQQYAWYGPGQLPLPFLDFTELGRYAIEQAVGGNNTWNKGVDYTRVFADSTHAREVAELYKAAGLDLKSDLDTLTAGADITADPAAVAEARRTSSAGQNLDVPLLDIHTTADNLVPVEQENRFAARVRAAGDGALLRQAYVARQGHCAFTTAETVAALHAVEHRLDTGGWGTTTTAAELQKAALGLNLDGAAYVPFEPARLTVGRGQ